MLQALEAFQGHPTSGDVLMAVDAIDTSIGRASVFRTLELFTQLNIIRPSYAIGNAPQYVLLPDGHHHHIVCMNCNRTIEFEDCGLDALQRRLEEEFGVQLNGHLLEFYGTCSDCGDA